MEKEIKGVLRIGTSGIVVPGSKSTFPAEYQNKTRLHYYTTFFNSVEINSSFHKLPKKSTFHKWYNEVPDTFKFTLKLWREVTHAKGVIFSLEDVEKFMQAAAALEHKKGTLLVQFPGKVSFDFYDKVERILETIKHLNQKNEWKVAVEFRNKTWYNNNTYSLLAKMGACIVFHDIASSKTPFDSPVIDTVYLRFHGPNGDYKGSYSNDFLLLHARNIKNWLREGRDVYVYFNNTMGDAFLNAQSLQQLIQSL